VQCSAVQCSAVRCSRVQYSSTRSFTPSLPHSFTHLEPVQRVVGQHHEAAPEAPEHRVLLVQVGAEQHHQVLTVHLEAEGEGEGE
jgi:hypothetical protein